MVKSIQKEFISGFVQAMDGEKDPRNLLISFKIISLIVENLDFQAHVEVKLIEADSILTDNFL